MRYGVNACWIALTGLFLFAAGSVLSDHTLSAMTLHECMHQTRDAGHGHCTWHKVEGKREWGVDAWRPSRHEREPVQEDDLPHKVKTVSVAPRNHLTDQDRLIAVRTAVIATPYAGPPTPSVNWFTDDFDQVEAFKPKLNQHSFDAMKL